MSLTHPSTVYLARGFDRAQLLAEAAEARRAAQARRIPTGRTAGASTAQHRLGSALVAIGRRLQGAEPGGLARTATAESSAAS